MLINVLKFGGTSVANLKRIENVVKIVEKRMNSLKDQYKEIDIMLNDLKGIKKELSRVMKYGRK